MSCCLISWIVSYHHLCILGRYWAACWFKYSTSRDSGTACFFNFVWLILCNREIKRHWVCKKGLASLMWKVLFIGWKKDGGCRSARSHICLSHRMAEIGRHLWDGLLQHMAEQGHWAGCPGQFSHLVSEMSLHIRGQHGDKQPFTDKKLQCCYNYFQLSTKIANDRMKERRTSSPRDPLQIKIRGSRFFTSAYSLIWKDNTQERWSV